MGTEVWSDGENDTIVAVWFDMLRADLTGRRINKAAENRKVQELLGRNRGSIEFKHCNISAAARGLGLPVVTGYKPRFNFQMSLAEAVSRWLARHPGWDADLVSARPPGIAEAPPIFVGIPPTLRNQPPPEEAAQLDAVARRFDVAGRDERNRALGRAGEERVVQHERALLRQKGRGDLARRVRWVSQEDGDGAGYDIASFTADGQPRLIEVKTTNGWERTPFHISRNELAVSETRGQEWCLFRLYDFARSPRAFELRSPLQAMSP